MHDERLDQLDYYTLLGLAQNASRDHVRSAFHAFAMKFHPDRHSSESPENVERVARVYRRGAEAYRVLTDPELRRAYDLALKQGELRLDVSAVSSARPSAPTSPTGISSVSPKARPFVKKADEAARAGDWKTAKLNLQLAQQHQGGSHPVIDARLADLEAKSKKG